MDSVTHILAGGAIGETTLGRKAGWRAMAWGATVAVLPDIDVAIGQFMSEIDALVFHRGWTHSLVFILLMTPMLGTVAARIHSQLKIPPWQWMILIGLSLFSHVLLDLCTSYGTQVLLPFTDTAYAWSNIAIIDPLFTLPYLIAIPFIIRFRHKPEYRRFTAIIAIAISGLYLGLTLINKTHVERQFVEALEREGIEWEEAEVKPILFSNLLWRGIAREADTYTAGFYALPDNTPFAELYEIQGDHYYADHKKQYKPLRQLVWITEGFYQIERQGDELYLNDLRFGRMGEWEDRSSPYTFTYHLDVLGSPPDSMRIRQVELEFEGDRERRLLRSMINRIRNGPATSNAAR